MKYLKKQKNKKKTLKVLFLSKHILESCEYSQRYFYIKLLTLLR